MMARDRRFWNSDRPVACLLQPLTRPEHGWQREMTSRQSVTDSHDGKITDGARQRLRSPETTFRHLGSIWPSAVGSLLRFATKGEMDSTQFAVIVPAGQVQRNHGQPCLLPYFSYGGVHRGLAFLARAAWNLPVAFAIGVFDQQHFACRVGNHCRRTHPRHVSLLLNSGISTQGYQVSRRANKFAATKAQSPPARTPTAVAEGRLRAFVAAASAALNNAAIAYASHT